MFNICLPMSQFNFRKVTTPADFYIKKTKCLDKLDILSIK